MQGNKLSLIGIDMLITDGASIQMMSSELVGYYENPDLEKPKLQFSFRDYVLANNEFKKKSYYEADKKYWMDRMSDFSNAPELPLKMKPSEVGKPKFNRQTRFFESKDWQRVMRACKKYNVTEAALLCCIYAEVLSYWSNQKNLVLNTTVFNRLPFHNDVHKMLGDFTSTMLLDIRLQDQEDFWTRVESVQEILLDALEHRHYDGIEFIRELTKYRGTSGQALMPVVFTSMLFGKGGIAR